MAVLGIAIFFGVVTLALSAHMYSATQLLIVYDFEQLSIAVAVLTILSAPAFLVIGLLRKGSILTMNVVEIPVLGFLSILWLANAALYAEWDTIFSATCSARILAAGDRTFCGEFHAVEALSFITWIALLGYVGTTIILCIIGKNRGNDVWMIGAQEADYFTFKHNTQAAAQPQYTGSTVPAQYTGQSVPMQQQYSGQQQPQQMVYGQPQPQQVPVQPQMAYSPPPQGHAQV
ncbi:hypothetical protein L218DRAFT_1007833 [Marasmius fiardii PR-910]|nr:hypothetical protein L218DRAFT_1007833 [Marasmius fiardii PR-910]